MKTYKITGNTNGYIAARDINFNGKTEIVLKSGLSLKDAQAELLNMFNSDYENENGFSCNWGVARRKRKHETSTFNDGTRSYEFDSRYYRIELEENEGE